jgi:hypothetical protein
MQPSSRSGCCPDALVGYFGDQYGIRVHDGGSSFVAILHCPWCGTELVEQLGNRSFDGQAKTGSVLLVFISPNRDPGEVTVALGLTPFQAWRGGERKSSVLLDGTLMQHDSTHQRSGWKASLRNRDKESSLQEQAAFWLRELAARKGPVAQLQKLGWKAELNCFSAGTAEFELEPDELALLGSLSVRLAVFALCSTEDHEAR